MGAAPSSFNAVLHDAAASGDTEKVVSVAATHPHLIDTAHPGQSDQTPLYVAAMNGRASVVETLHRLGSMALDRPDRSDWTPMHAAAAGGHASVVQILHRLGSTVIDQPDDDGRTPMHLAAESGHASVIETLHRLGSTTIDRSDKSGETPMFIAAFYGQVAVIETLHRLGSMALDWSTQYGWTPVYVAAMNGHASVVETLIRLGSTTLDHSGAEILQLAFERKGTTVAELLFAAGVNVAALAGRYPEEVCALLATPKDRLLELRHRLYFSRTLFDVLLNELNKQELRCSGVARTR